MSDISHSVPTKIHHTHKRVIISIDQLEKVIVDIMKNANSMHYAIPLGIFFSLLPNFFLVSTYQDFSNIHPTLGKGGIQLIYFIIEVIVFLWFIFSFFNPARNRTIEMYINDIVERSDNDITNVALFLLKAKIYDDSNKPVVKFLFRRELFWDMWAIPNYHMSDKFDDEHRAMKVFETVFPVRQEDVKISRCYQLDFSDEKMSQETGFLTTFNFEGFYIVFQAHNCFLCMPEFTIGDIKYKWLTIEEAQSDKITWERNKNVLLKLKNEFASITNQFPSSCEFNIEASTLENQIMTEKEKKDITPQNTFKRASSKKTRQPSAGPA